MKFGFFKKNKEEKRMKFFRKALSAILAASLLLGSISVDTIMVSAATPSRAGGWYESIYAEWKDADPDNATVEYKLSTDSAYTALKGNDAEYLIREAASKGYGRVDIPGLKEGTYDLRITASDKNVYERKNISVIAFDRSGYAHWTPAGPETYNDIGGYNNDGTPKSNAIVVYVTDENKDTVAIPGYEDHPDISYKNKDGATWTRGTKGIGNILNNNYTFIKEVTDAHPLIIRFIGKVTLPKNLTPYNMKDVALGGSKGDNGNLAITKYGKNITLEGIGDDAEINGWGFTFSQTSTCPADSGKNFEVRNLTFRNYTEDALGFQGDDAISYPIERIWVHNNVFYPGYCANPTEGDKSEGDGSCDFKRGQYYTMSYNHYIKCHKTNLLGAGDGDDQFFMTLHHNWYQNVGARQPLGAGGNVHIYNTYFQDEMPNGANKHSTSTVIDLRGNASVLAENNCFEACKNCYSLRDPASTLKSFGNIYKSITVGGKQVDCEIQNPKRWEGKFTEVKNRNDKGLPSNGLLMPDGGSIADWDINSKYFYCDPAGNSIVEQMEEAEQVPNIVKDYAGTLHELPQTEFGFVEITVTDNNNNPVNDASVTASGLSFTNQGSGVYRAKASLYSEYEVTVSKDGFENVVITTGAIMSNGDISKGSAVLVPDTDGKAAVKLVSLSDGTPIVGAKVTLTKDNRVLTDNGDGTYDSGEYQYDVGEYSVTITDTGDFIPPEGPKTIQIKTTNAPTEIKLERAKGTVEITVKASEGTEKELDLSTAEVYAGTVKLEKTGADTFGGTVEVGVLLPISVRVPGWQIASIVPAEIKASVTGKATALVTLQEGGEEYIWDYTNGIGIEDEFFVFGSGWSNWGDAKKNPLPNPDDPESSLTNARKMESNKVITFDAPAKGKLLIVIHGKGGTPTIKLTNPDGTVQKGINVPSNGGTIVLDVEQGLNKLEKDSKESELYYLKYTAGDYVAPPIPGGGTTEEQTDEQTEEQTEETTYSIPVELGTPDTNNGSLPDGTATVEYHPDTDTWYLADTSSSAAAELIIPFKEPITKGEVIITGKVTPSTNNSKWGFIRAVGTVNGNEKQDVAAFATSEKPISVSLRTHTGTTEDPYVYTVAQPTTAVEGGTTYDYVIYINMDTKKAVLTVDGKTTASADIIVDALTGVGSITGMKDVERTVTLTTPYVGIPTEAPAPSDTLSDEYMWPVNTNLTNDDTGMLTWGDTFRSSTDEKGEVPFVDGDKTYMLSKYIKPNLDPKGADGFDPVTSTDNNNIPVSGGYIKFTPKANGVLTLALKTNAGKANYITDEAGTIVKHIDNINGNDSVYDIVRIDVKKDKSYNIFASKSKICIYYIGYTTDKDTEGSTSEPPTQGTTAQPPAPAGDNEIYGNADDNDNIGIQDAAELFDFVLGNGIEQTGGGVVTPGNIEESGWMHWLDVNEDKVIDSADVAEVLQKVLDGSYLMPVERAKN